MTWTQGILTHEYCVITRSEMVKVHPTARIDSFVKIEGGQGVQIGKHVHIGSFSHLNIGGGKLIFEDHSGCSSGCRIASATPNWEKLHISAADHPDLTEKIYYTTRICSYVALFVGVIVVPGVTVGEGAIVKPGSVVYDDVEPWSIVQGNPAKMIGVRNLKDETELNIVF